MHCFFLVYLLSCYLFDIDVYPYGSLFYSLLLSNVTTRKFVPLLIIFGARTPRLSLLVVY